MQKILQNKTFFLLCNKNLFHKKYTYAMYKSIILFKFFKYYLNKIIFLYVAHVCIFCKINFDKEKKFLLKKFFASLEKENAHILMYTGRKQKRK